MRILRSPGTSTRAMRPRTCPGSRTTSAFTSSAQYARAALACRRTKPTTAQSATSSSATRTSKPGPSNSPADSRSCTAITCATKCTCPAKRPQWSHGPGTSARPQASDSRRRSTRAILTEPRIYTIVESATANAIKTRSRSAHVLKSLHSPVNELL